MATTKKKVQKTPQKPQERLQPVQAGIDLAETPVGVIAGENGQLVVVHTERGLRLRSGPALAYPVAEVLADGTLLAVLELPYGAEVPGWALVHTGQRTGWVDIHFIRALEPAAEA